MYIYLPFLIDIFLSLLVWLFSFFLLFGIPFILAHLLTFLIAIKLKRAQFLFTFGPVLTTVLFIGLSFLSYFKILIHYVRLTQHLVNRNLIWFHEVHSSVEIFLIIGLLIIIFSTLTILVFRHARFLPKVFFPNIANMHQKGRAITISSNIIYGLFIALLIIPPFFIIFFQLPDFYLLPGIWSTVVPLAIFYLFTLGITYFLLSTTPVIAGYLATTAAFLAIGYISLYNINAIQDGVNLGYSFAGSIGQLFLLERWFGHLAIILPLTMICLIYLIKRVIINRWQGLKKLKLLALTAFISVPILAISLYAIEIDSIISRMGIFAVLITIVLFIILAVIIFTSLFLVFFRPIERPEPIKITPSVSAPVVKKHRSLFSLAGPIITILAFFVMLVITPFYRYPIIFLFLGAHIYLPIAFVFYLSRFLTVLLARALFTPERVNKFTLN